MKGKVLAIVSVFLVSGLGWLCFSYYSHLGEAKVVFLDVGQGSSAYIKTPEGYEILIDTGSSRAVLRELSKFRPFWDRHIDILIATHADGDHIGALPDILKRFDVSMFIDNGQSREGNGPYDTSRDLIAKSGYQYMVPNPGQTMFVGTDTRLDFYFPYPEYVDGLGLNKSSLVFMLNLAETNILFTGDAPKSIEQYLIREYGEELQADILVVGHHGSKTSTSDIFVETVKPDVAVISAGRDNPYGHPHKDVVETLEDNNAVIYGTYEYGSIEFDL